MHKLLEFVCDELEALEKKAEKSGQLSMTEIQYADTLAHLKKNLLTADAMIDEESSGSYEGSSYAEGSSFARGRGRNARRDSMGRYSGDGGSYRNSYSRRGGSYRGYSREGYSRDEAKEDMMMQLREMEQSADRESKEMIKEWMDQLKG